MGDAFCFRGRVVKSYTGHKNDDEEDTSAATTSAVCVSPTDDLVLACHKQKVIVWKTGTGEEVGVLDGHRSNIKCCSVSQDLLATGSENGIIHLWKYRDLKRVARIGLPLKPINACALSVSGRNLGVAYADKKPRIYTLYGGDGSLVQGPSYKELSGHNGGVTDMVFSNTSDDNLITSGTDGTVRFWRISTGECLITLEIPDEGSILKFDCLDASNIVLITEIGGLSVWNLETSERVWQVPGRLKLVSGSQGSQAVMVINTMDALFGYNVSQQKETVRKGTTHEGSILASAMTHDGKHFLTSGADGKVFLWE